MKHLSKLSAKLLLSTLLAPTVMLGSCSLMHDDLPDCAVAPDVCAAVNFVYDYNTADTDLFNDHCGSVTLYIFDAKGQLFKTIEHTASANDLHADGYEMRLELPAGTYKLYASARESVDGYDASISTPGAKFRRNGLKQFCRPTDITYTLDNIEGLVKNEGYPLEHLWLTYEVQEINLPVPETPAEGDPQPDDIVVRATIPLQRVCNNIHVDIVRGSNISPAALAAGASTKAYHITTDDYEAWIGTPDGRHELDLGANITAGAVPLNYIPHSIAPSSTDKDEPCLRAEFTTSRLIYDNTTPDDMLYIRNLESGKIFQFDLPQLLAKDIDKYTHRGWSEQEYLDREYDFNFKVVFNEEGDEWQYIDIYINMLSWAKRVQNVIL